MHTGRVFTGKKLPLTIGFAVLLVAAFGAGCSNFFQDNALNSIAIQPSSVNIQINGTQSFQAWGTYQDGTRSQITSGVVWTTSDSTIVSLSGATATGVASGTATITGSAQGLSGTSSVTVAGNVSSITVSPTNATMTENGNTQAFTFAATPGPPDFITVGNGGTLTITPVDSFFTCAEGTDNSGNPAEVCSVTSGAASSYTLQMSYQVSSNTINSNIATVTVVQ
ncbi:MAG: hypothetical protein WBQ72_11070 [Terriglobales bacterium]|jgi:hypothetical protein